MLSKIPEMKKTLKALEFFQEKSIEDEVIKTNYQLCQNVFCEADIKSPKKVYLYLGVNYFFLTKGKCNG
jgi:hypothetical protein